MRSFALDMACVRVGTPWVLGGPYPSSYRDHILRAATPRGDLPVNGAPR